MKVPSKLSVLFLIALVAVIAIIWVSDIASFITLANIKEKSFALQQMVHERYLYSVLSYIALITAVAAVSLPLIVILVLAGGFLFGTFCGALYATLGATLGGVVAFIVFRYVLHAFVQGHYEEQRAAFNEKIQRYGYTYILILHYITVIPLLIINMFAALTPISLPHFIVLTLIGSAPLYLIYAFTGRELATISCVQDIFSAQMILACLLLIVVALIPIVIKQYQNKQ